MTMERFSMLECQQEDCSMILEVLSPCTSSACAMPQCGDKPLKVLDEKTADASTEKHVPVIERNGKTLKVTVGSTLHPMEEKHYIQWIEIRCPKCKLVMRKFLEPGEDPVAEFPLPAGATDDMKFIAREHCNVHGLWRAEE